MRSMAAAFIADPSLLSTLLPSPGVRRPLSPQERRLQLQRKPLLLPAASPCAPFPCSCAAGTLDPEPADENTISSSSTKSEGKEGGRDRRRVVRIAWEKLVRWSRSWRSKAKSDVLERTKKVVVLGGGSFGTAMAAHLAKQSREGKEEPHHIWQPSNFARPWRAESERENEWWSTAGPRAQPGASTNADGPRGARHAHLLLPFDSSLASTSVERKRGVNGGGDVDSDSGCWPLAGARALRVGRAWRRNYCCSGCLRPGFPPLMAEPPPPGSPSLAYLSGAPIKCSIICPGETRTFL